MKKNMYRYLLIFSGCLLAGFPLRAQQLKLGSNPTMIDKTALLELESSNQGLLLPRISDTNAFHPNPIPNGMLIYYVGTSDSCLMIRKDGTWVKIVDFVNLSAHETDPIATAKTVSVKAGNPAILVTGGPQTQALGNNPSFTLSVPNTSPIWNADSLQSVKISTTLPTANQFLNFDGSQWTPVSFDTGYVPNFSQKVRNLFSEGTGISYNATTGQITNAGVTSFNGRTGAVTPANGDYNLSQLGDVNITFTSLANGQLLQYNGTNWVNSTPNFLTPSNVSGTTNYVAKFTGSNTLGNSQIFDNGTNVGIGTASPGAKLDVSGNINLSGGGNTVSSSGTELIMQETGDTYGTVRLHLQNRTGLNGALFENPALDLVDFGFHTNSGAQQNLRFEHRTGYLYNSNNTSGEFQFGLFGSPDNPNFIIGSYATFVRNGRFGINTNSPDSLLTVNGSSHFTGNLRLDRGLSINGNYGSAGQVLVSQGAGTAPVWQNASTALNAWSLTGNSGTNSSTNFIGTTDYQGITFKTNNQKAGYIGVGGGESSVALGAGSATSYQSAAYGANSNASSQSVAIGYNAQATGYLSTAVGNSAVANQNNNVAIGDNAQATGYQSIAIGGNNSTASGQNSVVIGTGVSTSQANAFILGNSSNNIGIHTSTPQANLDVNGTFKLGQKGTVLNNVIKILNFQINDPYPFCNGTRVIDVNLASVLPAGFTLSPGATIIMNPSLGYDLPSGLAVGWVRVNGNNTTIIRIGLINTLTYSGLFGGGCSNNSLNTAYFDITIIQ